MLLFASVIFFCVCYRLCGAHFACVFPCHFSPRYLFLCVSIGISVAVLLGELERQQFPPPKRTRRPPRPPHRHRAVHRPGGRGHRQQEPRHSRQRLAHARGGAGVLLCEYESAEREKFDTSLFGEGVSCCEEIRERRTREVVRE